MENDKIGDHRLDAFMLALGGLTLEEGRYAPTKVTHPANGGFVEKADLYMRAAESGKPIPGRSSSILQQIREFMNTDHQITINAYNDNEELNSAARRNREARERIEQHKELTRRRSDLYPEEETPYDALVARATPDQKGRDIDQWEYYHLQSLEKRVEEARSKRRTRARVN